MPDPTTSLFTRAKRLQAFARAERSAQEANQDHQRTTLALGKLDVALAELAVALKTYEALQAQGIQLSPLPALEAPPAELRAHIDSVGRPTPERLTGAVGKVSRATASILGDLDARWRTWSANRLDELPTPRIPRLAPPERRRVETRLASLRTDSRNAPTSASVNQFKLGFEAVSEALDAVTVHSLLEEALSKVMSSSPPVTLADLSDEEIAVLRDDSAVAAQIVLSRR